MEKIYTVPEVAKLLKLSTRSIYTYITEGKLKATKLGSKWRILDSAIKELLSEQSEQKGGEE